MSYGSCLLSSLFYFVSNMPPLVLLYFTFLIEFGWDLLSTSYLKGKIIGLQPHVFPFSCLTSIRCFKVVIFLRLFSLFFLLWLQGVFNLELCASEIHRWFVIVSSLTFYLLHRYFGFSRSSEMQFRFNWKLLWKAKIEEKDHFEKTV